MYADDTNLTPSGSSISEVQSMLEKDMQCIIEWLEANKLTLNVVKSEFMIIGTRQRLASLPPGSDLTINGITFKQVQQAKCLGLVIDEHLTWKGHIDHIKKKVITGLRILKKPNRF